MVQELERAVELEPNPESYSLLIRTYENLDMQAEADISRDKLKKLIVPAGKPKRMLRPKRVVI
jgi:hypothetical protein